MIGTNVVKGGSEGKGAGKLQLATPSAESLGVRMKAGLPSLGQGGGGEGAKAIYIGRQGVKKRTYTLMRQLETVTWTKSSPRATSKANKETHRKSGKKARPGKTLKKNKKNGSPPLLEGGALG